jgi:hypothetical protein
MPYIRRQIELLLIGIQIGNILAEDIIASAKRRTAFARPSGAGIECGSDSDGDRWSTSRWAARRRRSGRLRSGDSMVRVAISVEAFETIARTLPVGSVA